MLRYTLGKTEEEVNLYRCCHRLNVHDHQASDEETKHRWTPCANSYLLALALQHARSSLETKRAAPDLPDQVRQTQALTCSLFGIEIITSFIK